ncbi:MAG TPA: mandelate racemase/muconate lactonizing enzyme family protein [bacterium]|nr:mandelate racemase/muconate lactonizing enzyme family protein [bacterium]
MKITKVEAIPLRIPELDWTRADGIQDDVIVRVHTDAGITGVGEADASPHVVKALVDAPESWMRSRGVAGMLVGEDPLHTERLWDKMYEGTLWMGRGGVAVEAIAAVDLALWDIKGKVLGLPVHTLLGGARRDTIPVYASMLFEKDLGLMRDTAQRYVAQGYRAVKFGWGPIGPDFATDVMLVREARAAIGDAALLVDAGAPWTLREAIRRLDAFQEYSPFWLEEALASDDVSGWARLTAASRGTRIATGEQETLAGAFRALLEIGHVDVIQPDLARAGGFTQGRRIADLAAAHHALLVPHAWKSGILVAASMHFAATLPDVPFVEYTVAESPLRRDLVRSDVEVTNGIARIPQRPGLGVELNEEIVERYRVDR